MQKTSVFFKRGIVNGLVVLRKARRVSDTLSDDPTRNFLQAAPLITAVKLNISGKNVEYSF